MDFLTMNGYGGYVWASFGLTLAVLVWNVVQANRRHALIRRQLLNGFNAPGDNS